MKIDIPLSDCIAFLSIIVSITLYFRQTKLEKELHKESSIREQQINNINLESEIYMEIFSNFLIDEIPKSRELIIVSQDKELLYFDDFRTVLNNLKKRILYFKYRNKKIFDDLILAIYSIDDYIVNNSHQKLVIDPDDLLNELDKLIDNLYKLIFKYYLGTNE